MRTFRITAVSFKTRALVLATLVATVPFILFATGTVAEVQSSLLDKARAEHEAILTGIHQQIHGTLSNHQRLVQLLANDMRVQSMQPEAVHDALHNFHRFNDFFISTFIYDHAGTVKYIEHRNHYRGDDYLIGRKISEFPKRFTRVLQDILTSGNSGYYDYIQDDETQSFLLFMSPILPFSGEGNPVGVISSAVQLYGNQFQELLDPVEVKGSSYCLILDRRGRVIARKGAGIPLEVHSVKMEGVSPPTNREGLTASILVGKRVDLVSMTQLPTLNCTLLVGKPREEVLEFLTSLTFRIVLFALVALILGVSCAMYLSRSLTRPILQLTEGIRKVGEGATAHRLQVEGDDELAQASEAFNRMAAYLQKSKLMEQIWRETWSEEP